MKNDSKIALLKAADCLSDAVYCQVGQRFEASVNRSYYCILDCLRALLYEKEIQAKTHAGVQTKFREFFIKTGIFDQEMNHHLTAVFELREAGDYDFSMSVEEADGKFCIEVAERFLNETRQYFEVHGN